MSKLKKPWSLETTFDHYTATEIIGEGGTGKVYRATNSAGEAVAIKVLDPLKGASRDRRRRFKNELLFGARNQHQGIVVVTDHGVVDIGGTTTPFYVMPLFERTLREWLAQGSCSSDVLPVFAQILDGVEAAHLVGVTHRDLKPENILHRAGAPWAIADFGVAEFALDELYTLVETAPGTRLANFQYSAPEQRVRGGQTDCRTDIFALGLILNEMFTGVVPQGTAYRTIGSVAPEFAYCDDLVAAMLRQEPADRPPSVDAVKQQLIARKNEFVERQRLSTLRERVIPVSELDDPIARDPIRIIDFDWDQGMLTLKLNRHVTPEWTQAIQFGSYPKRSILGKGPEHFNFRGDTASISVNDNQVQSAIDYFKSWLGPAHTIYVDRLKTAQREREQRAREAIQREIEAIERRRSVLSKVKI
jgi:serine/threonine protein kinase